MIENSRPHTQNSMPADYQIRLQGKLDETWSAWFDDMRVSLERDEEGQPVTILTGCVIDQPALHGLLSRIRDLGLMIVSIQRLKGE